MTVRVRFAPSPTGHLHVGNVRTALYNWLFARQNEGVFVLRVEDTDLTRSQNRFEQELIEDLKWLGLTWDEGVEVGGNYGPYRQTDRLELYQNLGMQLLNEEKAYYCFCSAEGLEQERQRQLAAGLPPRYSGKCRQIPLQEAIQNVQEGKRAAVRMKVGQGTVDFEDMVFGPLRVDCREIGDFILLRSDGTAPYNFACVVDDVFMKITHLIRGEGHISNTYRQLLIYHALAFDPPQFAHLSTIFSTDGAKLSKRHGATSIDEFRHHGYLPAALVNYLALLGWAPRQEGEEILTPEQLISEFDLSRVNRSPATFDWEKLNWVNRSHLKKLDPSRLTELAVPYFVTRGWIPPQPSPEVKTWLGRIIEAVFKYVNKLEDLVKEADLIFTFEPEKSLSEPSVQKTLSQAGAPQVIREFHNLVQQHRLLDLETYRKVVAQVKESTGQKGKHLFHPIRVALTARSSGFELDRLIPILQEGEQLDLPVKILPAKVRVRLLLDHLHDYLRNQSRQ
ncbi:glutamate--tRNA ligase [Acidobacteria bacterium AH-259-D05]|nr:glutamate--tRNA ligase [Acidobacteria bacterium AH-259-D05]